MKGIFLVPMIVVAAGALIVGQTSSRLTNSFSLSDGRAVQVWQNDDVMHQLTWLTPTDSKATAILLPEGVGEVRAISTTRAEDVIAAVGRSENRDSIYFVNVESRELVSVVAGHSSTISPSGRFVALQGLVGRLDAANATQYFAMSTDRAEIIRGMKALRPVFPNDRFQHIRQSELQWLSSNVLAFLDFSYEHNTTSVVVIYLNANGDAARVFVRPLPTDEIVDRARLRADIPASLSIAGATITPLRSSEGLDVRLRFPASTPVRVRRIDLSIW